MKLKATVAEDTPRSLVRALNAVRPRVQEEVIGPHLHRPSFGPAELYVQVCDEGDSSAGLFCEVRLSGVTRTRDRSEADFDRSLSALAAIYRQTIRTGLPKGQRLQMMVSIMVDTPPSLFETDAEWVEGRAEPVPQ